MPGLACECPQLDKGRAAGLREHQLLDQLLRRDEPDLMFLASVFRVDGPPERVRSRRSADESRTCEYPGWVPRPEAGHKARAPQGCLRDRPSLLRPFPRRFVQRGWRKGQLFASGFAACWMTLEYTEVDIEEIRISNSTIYLSYDTVPHAEHSHGTPADLREGHRNR